MGGKSSGSDVAEQTRADELARQQRVREGTARINSIFDGGTYVSGRVGSGTAYDPNQTYYNADGSVFTMPTTSTSSAGAGTNFGGNGLLGRLGDSDLGGASQSSPWETALASGLYTSRNQTTGQFGEDFFDQRQQSYLDYATPQINNQYSDAQKELTYALARSGKLASSSRADLASELQRQFDLQTQKAADDALNYRTQAQTSVEDARANLITTLNATGDADQAASSALARAQALSQPAAYSPLTDLFSSYVDALGSYTAAERARAYGWGGNATNSSPTYYGSNSGSVSVRN